LRFGAELLIFAFLFPVLNASEREIRIKFSFLKTFFFFSLSLSLFFAVGQRIVQWAFGLILQPDDITA
jgi:glycopeptide antibiotics resistance protein